jgi:hypothetical protein
MLKYVIHPKGYKMRIGQMIVLTVALILLLNGEALAYADLGTGGLLYQLSALASGAVAGCFSFIGHNIGGI